MALPYPSPRTTLGPADVREGALDDRHISPDARIDVRKCGADEDELDTWSLPDTLQDTLNRLRFMLKSITGEALWNDPPAIMLTALATALAGVAAGYKVARGETALDGSNPTPVATGLTTVVAFTATLKGTAAPGVGTSVLTADISGATVNVYAWKPTSNADPTLIASTGTESFYWVAVGT